MRRAQRNIGAAAASEEDQRPGPQTRFEEIDRLARILDLVRRIEDLRRSAGDRRAVADIGGVVPMRSSPTSGSASEAISLMPCRNSLNTTTLRASSASP